MANSTAEIAVSIARTTDRDQRQPTSFDHVEERIENVPLWTSESEATISPGTPRNAAHCSSSATARPPDSSAIINLRRIIRFEASRRRELAVPVVRVTFFPRFLLTFASVGGRDWLTFPARCFARRSLLLTLATLGM
ncbi:hypothetical protein NL676_016854 [Syzygium grande]|nr:hypothetical protein NL676_016854 [Syzygium grande]